MGASGSKIEEDKALQLCRERKKFVRQALDGRCSLAAAHITYIESLKNTGTNLRTFVEPEASMESSLCTSTTATPEPAALTEKSLSQFSFSSPSALQHDATENLFPSPSLPSYGYYQENHMKFRGTFLTKVEEKPPIPVVGSVNSNIPLNSTYYSTERTETSTFATPLISRGSQPWDYFGLRPIDDHFSSHELRGFDQGFENADDVKQLREEEGIPVLKDEEENILSHAREDSQDSEDEFDEPSAATLVRSFENVNRATDPVATSASPIMTSAESVTSEAEFLNRGKSKSPDLSPLRTTSGVAPRANVKLMQANEDGSENKVAPKDFFACMRDIESLFVKASESGREVPRMLEANKFHFRAIFPGKESGSMMSSLLKSCFSCGEDQSQVQEGPPQTSIKYLTWHRTTSSHSSSSINLVDPSSKYDNEDLTSNLYDNFCMISGSHASTLDRLYAWEKKLYDEVKASEMVRKEYDLKCKLLRQLESKGESSTKTDKLRAVVKDLHSRIRVAIHRIDSISKKIEELRDKELQPQLEELIEGLKRMWESMFECHKLQFQTASILHNNNIPKLSMQSDSRRQITIQLENELNVLSSSFSNCIGAQKAYVEAIKMWLFKCVSPQQKSTKRKRRMQPSPLRNYGPPIYTTCDVWLEMLGTMPTEKVADSMKDLAAGIACFVPHQEKNQRKGKNNRNSASWQAGNNSDPDVNILRAVVSEDWMTSFDRFWSRLVCFLHQLNDFAESSVKMYAELQKAIQEAKCSYDQRMFQSQQSFDGYKKE